MYASRMTAILLSALLAVTAAAAGEIQLPAKTNLELSLETPIDERTMAPSGEITFKLVNDLKKDGVVFAQKGAAVTARVTRMQKHSAFIRSTKRNYFIVGVRLLSLNTGQGTINVVAGLETVRPTATNDYFVPFSRAPEKWGQFGDDRSYLTIPTPEAGESLFGVVREYLHMPKGVRMVFRTPDSQ